MRIFQNVDKVTTVDANQNGVFVTTVFDSNNTNADISISNEGIVKINVNSALGSVSFKMDAADSSLTINANNIIIPDIVTAIEGAVTNGIYVDDDGFIKEKTTCGLENEKNIINTSSLLSLPSAMGRWLEPIRFSMA